MKVFLSWSGELSHKVAVLFRDWLPSVIQSVEPYVSSEDIDKGARWSTDIARELDASAFGILFVTRDNFEAPWLNFEAGALSKSVEKGRVSPFLFAIKRSEVKPGPILQFQSTIAEREDVLKLLHSINAGCQQGQLDEGRLNNVFDVWWPQLEKDLQELEKSIPAPGAGSAAIGGPLKDDGVGEILEEVLELVRQQNRVLNDPLQLIPPGYLESVIGSFRGIEPGHPAFDDVARGWLEVREQVSRLREQGLPVEGLTRAIDRVSSPLSYLIDRYSEFSPTKRRRNRLADLLPPSS